MNKMLLLLGLSSLCWLGSVSAQITLTHSKHALRVGDSQSMHKAEYRDPGPGGIGQVWDFSTLNFYGFEKSELCSPQALAPYGYFPSANIAIAGDQGFYGMYEVDAQENSYLGYFGNDYRVVFSQPQRRMVYPFTYGNYYTSSFSGQGFYPEKVTTDIAGDYSFEADAYGTLILPHATLKNVLRVKTEFHKYEFARCYFTETHQSKYLYYTDQQRYPVFAILETQWVQNGGDTTYHRSLAVNPSIALDLHEPKGKEVPPSAVKDYVYSSYPNPFQESFKVAFELEEPTMVTLELYAMTGVRLAVLLPKTKHTMGVYEMEFQQSQLPAATYFIKYIFNDRAFVKPIIKKR